MRAGHLDRPAALELLEPARRDRAGVGILAGLEPRDAVGEHHEPGAEHRLRLPEILPLAAADEHPAERGLRRPRQRLVVALAAAFRWPEVVVVGLEHEGELPGLAAVPRHRDDSLRVATWLRLHHEPTDLAEHGQVAGRRPRADHDPGDRPAFDRLRQPVAAGRGRPDELLHDQPLLGIELVKLDLFGPEDDRPRTAGGVAGDVELHAGRHEHRGPRLGRCRKVEQEHERAAGAALVGNR